MTAIVLTGGGTGGHVFPALSVAAAFRDLSATSGTPIELIYVGLRDGPESRLAPEHGIEFRSVRARGIRGRNPLGIAIGVASIAAGTLQAVRILGQAGAKAVLATGGYVTVPVAIAARLRRIPLIVYLPDVQPGWAVRFTARMARRVATTNEDALGHLPAGKGQVLGYPVRPGFRALGRAEARRRLALGDDERLLLVTGATQGAASMNDAIASRLDDFLGLARVIHICGPAHEARFAALRDALPPGRRERYTVLGFSDDMPALMLAADIAVMRAGASVLGELPAAALPAVLVPGTFAGGHQTPNARYLASRDAAVIVDDARLDTLYGVVGTLLADPARLAGMRGRLRALDRPNAARDIAALVLAQIAPGEGR